MKLKICLRKSGEKEITYDADIKNSAVENVATAGLLFADMAKSDMARGWELSRWQVRRSRDKWKGLASEESPRLHDGDHVTLIARKAGDA